LDRSKLTEKFIDYDDRLLANKILDAVEYCEKNFTYKTTTFLDPRQQKLIESLLTKEKNIKYHVESGIEENERKLYIIAHDDYDMDDIEKPYQILEFSWYNKGVKKPSHRDFLGSIIGAGIKRDMLGDIILQEDKAYVVCSKEVSEYILFNIDRVGSLPVKVKIVEHAGIIEEKEKTINTTVSSLRLDGIISAGFAISRTKAAELIKSGRVRINWEEKDVNSKVIKQSDVISIRGKGRIILEEIAGNTKKDKIRIVIKKFV
jgi:RNA-binding protein YlmH